MSRRILAPIVVAAAVAGGGVAGALVGVPGISSAQDAPSQTQPAPAAASQRDGAVKAAADALGLSVKDLAKELRSGKTIAEIATEHGVAPQTVVDALVDAADQRIDKVVANGRITAERAARINERLSERITRFVNEWYTHKGGAGTDA